jgi:phosphocarrier protein HPr
MVEKKFVIVDKTGIHARPATQMVNKASQYDSKITLTNQDRTVNLKSIMGVLSLGIGKGEEIVITAEGLDELDALHGVEEVIKAGLGELSQ